MALGEEEEVQNIEGWFDLIRLETTSGEEPRCQVRGFLYDNSNEIIRV